MAWSQVMFSVRHFALSENGLKTAIEVSKILSLDVNLCGSVVTIGWLVKFTERVFESFLQINMKYIETWISLNIAAQKQTYLYCFR